ncbi:MAG TPA: SET domain-containing protein-lysine N-methyltransferase [Rhizomicrobium sp.]|nr:SET domain-containing protein-lysine N-methyltransferase [Rhizomicrobium sp.]
MEKITLKKIPGKGRGVVATKPIAAGEVFERSPVLPLALADSECPGLTHYSLAWGEDVPGLLPEGKECAIGLGYLCLYNHSDTPNITFDHHYDSDEISVRATRDIAAGEELTLNYGVPLWFDDATHVSK